MDSGCKQSRYPKHRLEVTVCGTRNHRRRCYRRQHSL